ncbi:MAG: CDP-archaeol synthase [Gammaproteobacteria bacterium]|nr:CDP-archaeol synthase [Gammaproteobacteria bacterium]NIR83195.1 CDP-archaeol synthase [Gammaproteobacteria bacterium]NIR91003.1 CDP-archaeol synthase [Gammaproteobacteria bacterium]NIU04360.1 CDP-archaeol synthase [Gammaproteobacteria bacterium]NIV52583.1 CDP-archaeol synthase [Gammaproteobacteria bacterium]
MTVLVLLLLLLVANGAPLIAHHLLGDRLSWPLDGGRRFLDGRPLLGPAKTLRGVGVAVLACAMAGSAVGPSLATGALFGLYAMAGDVLASFIKRRMGIAPSHSALGLDQGLEALLPLLALRGRLSLHWTEIALTVVGFFVLEIVLSRILYRLRVRRRPI